MPSSHVWAQKFCFEQNGLSSSLGATTTMNDAVSGPFLRITKTDLCPTHGDGWTKLQITSSDDGSPARMRKYTPLFNCEVIRFTVNQHTLLEQLKPL
jgi:hypothetical protein